MTNRVIEPQHRRKVLGALRTKVVAALLPGAMWICLAATPCLAGRYRFGVDLHPQQVGPNAWHFAIDLRVKPIGRPQFVGSQYDFASATQGIAIDYDFNSAQGGSGFSDARTFMAIAPTLFDPIDGFKNGWDATDLKDGIFSGVVYSTAPPTAVYFMIEARRFVRVRRPH